jgi:hypothetical protein
MKHPFQKELEMRRIFTSMIGAATTPILLTGLLAAQGSSTPIKVSPPSSIDVVFFQALNAGKVLATTDAMGKGNMDVTDLLNLGKLDVVEEKCQDRDRILLVPMGVQTPDNQGCRKRRVGGFWAGRDKTLDVKLPGAGLSTGAKTGIVAGAVGAGILVATQVGGGSSSTGTGGGGSGGTTTSPTTFNGTYTGTLVAGGNGCNFSQTSSVRGVLTVDTTGKGTWVKTHVNTGVTFNFNVSLSVNGSAASFTATTSQAVGSQNYNVTDVVGISGSTLTITQTFQSVSTTSCTAQYTGQLTKN